MRPLDPDQQLGYLVVRLAHELSRVWLSALRVHGINPRQFSTLSLLVREPSLSQGELARRVMVTPQSMSDSIADLIAARLLARGTVEKGRPARLEVTRKGKALLAKAYPLVAAIEARSFKALTKGERTELGRLLTQVLARR